MTTITMTETTKPRGCALPLLLLAVFGLAGMYALGFISERQDNAGAMMAAPTVDRSVSHALERHQQGAVSAWNCFDNRGAAFTMFNWWRNSWTRVCQDDNSKQVYFQILRKVNGKIQETTAYPKDGVFDLSTAAQILIDQGAVPTWVRPGISALCWLVELISTR
jgi:hypothetical protein